MTVTSQLELEIQEQPQTLANLLEQGREAVVQAAAAIRSFAPEWVVIAARGTSDNAARYAKYLFGAHNGLGVGLAVPSLCTLYEAPPRMSRALVIGISQSGQSPDVVSVLQAARSQGGMCLAITNDPDSPLAAAASHCIPLATGEERSVAATKTYTNQLLALAMLSAELSDDDGHREALARVPGYVKRALISTEALVPKARELRCASQFLVMGRGFNYCTAFEIALKMKETSYVLAEPYSAADLLHGPVAMVDESFPVIVVAPSGKTTAQAGELMQLLAQRKARVITISDVPELLEQGQIQIPLPGDMPEWISPMVSVVPGQQWARALAIAKDLDPDNPRGLSKVTLTH